MYHTSTKKSTIIELFKCSSSISFYHLAIEPLGLEGIAIVSISTLHTRIKKCLASTSHTISGSRWLHRRRLLKTKQAEVCDSVAHACHVQCSDRILEFFYTPPFKIRRHFGFPKYITFAIRLDIYYV